MAVGDVWRRWIMARLPDGREEPVRFDDFDPRTMTALTLGAHDAVVGNSSESVA
jgi:hypothetical protein